MTEEQKADVALCLREIEDTVAALKRAQGPAEVVQAVDILARFTAPRLKAVLI